jgi:uncharacterized cupin superfamily protein
MAAPILNIADAQYVDLAELSRKMGNELPQERFGGRRGAIGSVLGARQLGYSVTVIAPGKRAFPFHSHRANEEMFFIIEGTGQLRFGSETHPLRAGDVVACPTGGPEVAHQIVNTGAVELKVLGVSTMLQPEVCHYPDSGKFAVLHGMGADGFRHVGRTRDGVPYWEGE